ncbi:MAG: hypothetical protein RSB78_04640 [Oscillospiraceae bacterium]
MQNSTLLKIVSIIMIVLASIFIILGVISLVGIGALVAGTDTSVFVLVLFALLGVVGQAFQIIAGVIGVRVAGGKGSIKVCFVLSVIILALAALSFIGSIVDKTFSWTTIVGVILPILYFVGAYQVKTAAAQTPPSVQ